MKKFKKTSGYTLMEMIIVMTLITLMLPAVFSILFAITRQQARLYRVVETKRQGDAIMSNMKETISRRAQVIRSSTTQLRCDTPNASFSSITGTDFWLVPEPGGNYFRYEFTGSNGTVSYQEGTNVDFSTLNQNVAINNNQVTISNFSISCFRRSAYSTPLVQFSYTVSYNSATTGPENTVSLRYQTKIRLRQ